MIRQKEGDRMLNISEALGISYDEVHYMDFTVIYFRKGLLRSVGYMRLESIMGLPYRFGRAKNR